jgi:hypothetical protein
MEQAALAQISKLPGLKGQKNILKGVEFAKGQRAIHTGFISCDPGHRESAQVDAGSQSRCDGSG